jgi:hypothetical protein
MNQTLTQKKLKSKQVQRPGDRGQQDVESEDKSVPVIIGALGTKNERITSESSVTPRSAVGHRATGHTNEHCTQHLLKCWGKSL